MVAEDENEGHFRGLIATRLELFKRPVDAVVQGLDQAGVKLVAALHDLGLHLALEGGQRAVLNMARGSR